mmetsp:Transcript_283/g.981  ORF Transcript_283/g.981 Transcript_283/m.981 type:complete len:85 (-) Transcript_283:174-428(-)
MTLTSPFFDLHVHETFRDVHEDFLHIPNTFLPSDDTHNTCQIILKKILKKKENRAKHVQKCRLSGLENIDARVDRPPPPTRHTN